MKQSSSEATFFQTVKKFPAFCRTELIAFCYEGPRQLISRARWTQSTPSHSVSLRSILISSLSLSMSSFQVFWPILYRYFLPLQGVLYTMSYRSQLSWFYHHKNIWLKLWSSFTVSSELLSFHLSFFQIFSSAPWFQRPL